MIGFDRLGKNGRFGNQMFQYAALKGIAKKNNYDFCIPSGPKNEGDFYDEENQHKLFIAFNVNVESVDNFSAPYAQESSFNFDKELFENCEDNVNLYGFFQTEKYFKHIEDEIRKDFTFKKDWLEPCKESFEDKEYIGLHIRRTDYVQKQSYHPLCTLDYYERALKKLPNIPVIIVSDDPEWCGKQELFKPNRFFISDSSSNIIDMCILSLCKYHIIANSSFSWWGAWLAESEKVIAPKIWYGSQANLDDSDLVPQHWERI
tara:strand:+ start:4338 stop:5120 length:783 start_codon:yes stop_codon:yes gene_type:complete